MAETNGEAEAAGCSGAIERTMELRMNPRQVVVFSLRIVAVLTVINCVEIYFYFYLDDTSVYGLVDLFDFAIEGNIPTFYSAVAILFCSALLALISYANWQRPDGDRFYWVGLAILFLFLAVDEAVAIHEAVGDYFEQIFDASGFLYYMWVLPYGIATIVLGLVFLKFLWNLPRSTRARFIEAGGIFVTGAIGMEMLGAREADLNGTETVLYCVLYTIEELLEMLGIVLFIYALLSHFTQDTGRVSLVLELPHGEPQQEP